MSREIPVTVARVDPESAGWLRALADSRPQPDEALAGLRGLLARIARGEVARRGPRLQKTGPELDDIACQSAADALLAATSKLRQFHEESRFTTWAYKVRHLRGVGQDRAALFISRPCRRTPRTGTGGGAGLIWEDPMTRTLALAADHYYQRLAELSTLPLWQLPDITTAA